MAEKRKHKRFVVRCKVICRNLKGPWRKLRASGRDISFGGIGVGLKKPLDGADDLKLEIYRPYRRTPITAKARLVWQNVASDFSEIRAGLEFTEISCSAIRTFLSQ